MPRTRLFRVAAAVMALLTSVTTPGLAYAHGRAHAHIAAEHAGVEAAAHGADHHDEHADEHADEHDADAGHGDGHATDLPAVGANDRHAALEVEPSSHDHAHGHLILSDATTPRHDVHVVAADIVAMPGRHVDLTQPIVRRDVCAAVRTIALLARPGPVSGPPPSPRAPPAR